jgi:hypothetical protein
MGGIEMDLPRDEHGTGCRDIGAAPALRAKSRFGSFCRHLYANS